MTQVAASPSSSTEQRRPQIALIGNPNTGKSALFNRLTGSRQRVGNYPGLTVEKKIGTVRLDSGEADVIDLPGIYSLAAISPDERVVLDVLAGKVAGVCQPDLLVCVVDACNLKRNLFLITQIAEAGLPAVLALNMWDTAEARKIGIDLEVLSARLGVPIIPTVGAKGHGVDQLKAAISKGLSEYPMMTRVAWPKPVADAFEHLTEQLRGAGGRRLTPAETQRLMFDVDADAPLGGELDAAHRDQCVAQSREILKHGGYEVGQVETAVRYAWIDDLLSGVLTPAGNAKRAFSESIDDLLTHRVFGLAVFGAVMYVVFQAIYTLAGPFMDLIEMGFWARGKWIGGMLEGMPILQSLVVDGLVGGVGGVLIFLPQIVILFLFISLLEDAGYMPRAAFLMDRLFGWCGLSGKSFVPMLSSYACAVPGIMATRTIQEPKARLTTILVCPLMSCSARLPVYVLLIGAFIEPIYGPAWAGFTLFVMHFVGLGVAIVAAFIFNRLILRGRPTPFVLEMPPYRVPQWRDVLWRVYERAREFVLRAGTVILAMSVVIWAMCYFPRPDSVREQALVQRAAELVQQEGITEAAAVERLTTDEALIASVDTAAEGHYLEQSLMGRLGHTVQPVFAPAGFDWKITVGVLASFPAREVIISTLGILYNLGADASEEDEGLVAAMRNAKDVQGNAVFTPVVAVAIMVFFALCSQCMATLVVIAREANWKWAVFSFVYMTVLAWGGAVLVYQVGTALFPVA